MATAAPWVFVVTGVIELLIVLVTLVIGVIALFSCAFQRGDAFAAIGTLSKGIWILLIAGTLLLTLLLGQGGIGIFGMIAAGVALVYLLDVRPALRDATGGSSGGGGW